jgi:hypothetical protein
VARASIKKKKQSLTMMDCRVKPGNDRTGHALTHFYW